jgi:chemotaxis protein histidine kinase CheA
MAKPKPLPSFEVRHVEAAIEEIDAVRARLRTLATELPRAPKLRRLTDTLHELRRANGSLQGELARVRRDGMEQAGRLAEQDARLTAQARALDDHAVKLEQAQVELAALYADQALEAERARARAVEGDTPVPESQFTDQQLQRFVLLTRDLRVHPATAPLVLLVRDLSPDLAQFVELCTSNVPLLVDELLALRAAARRPAEESADAAPPEART